MSYTMAQANGHKLTLLLANITSEADLRSLISQLDVVSGAQPELQRCCTVAGLVMPYILARRL